jgi:hypothetical protein
MGAAPGRQAGRQAARHAGRQAGRHAGTHTHTATRTLYAACLMRCVPFCGVSRLTTAMIILSPQSTMLTRLRISSRALHRVIERRAHTQAA